MLTIIIIKPIVKLHREVDKAELDTNHEQSRKEHQDGAGVLVGDEGPLAPDGVEVGGEEEDRGDDNRVVVPYVLVLVTLVDVGYALLVPLSIDFSHDLVCRGDVPGVVGDDDDKVHQGDEGHPESQTVDRGSHLCLCY